MSKSQSDMKLEMAVDAIRGAMTNIRVALQLIGEIRSEAATGQQGAEQARDPDRPAMFGGRKAVPEQVQALVRPTTANEADSQSTEG